jgi:hypothetical protein
MSTPAKHRGAEETYIRIKTLTESKGWEEFLLPYILKEMSKKSESVMLDKQISQSLSDQLRGGYQALHELLQHIEQHQKLSASIIAKDEIKVNTPSR